VIQKRHWPLALTALRALLAPVVVLLALVDPAPAAFGACLAAAFLSDVFDGVIARRLGVATPGLRRLDSAADSAFYVAALFAAWHLHPATIRGHAAALVLLGVLEAVRYAVDLLKFGREASYHMWSSKLWGLALFAGCFSLLALGEDGLAVAAAIWVGVAADLEGLAISIVLRRWRTDVPSVVHAWRLRRASTLR
jgi:CDP-diacylglycerol--glycerol-3-phosphate 3-phosphatidyltransferase